MRFILSNTFAILDSGEKFILKNISTEEESEEIDEFHDSQKCLGQSSTVVPREVSKNGFFLHFFANIFLLVCRMVMIFLLTQRTKLGGPFRYLEHVRQANRKFSRGL